MQMKNINHNLSYLDIQHPNELTTPVVFSSPHSGRHYPQAFIDQSRLDEKTLRSSEDSFVDEIFACAPECGAPLIRALFPRAYVDVNREPFELDAEMFDGILPSYVLTRSSRISAGLGTIPKVVANGMNIYADTLNFLEARHRIFTYHFPYHQAVKQLLSKAEERFGASLLIDCHSMPSQHTLGRINKRHQSVDIVLGDNHTASCAPDVIALAEQVLVESGFRVARNHPYAGGYITQHYGQPKNGRHALQIEISRGLYMDERWIKRSPKMPSMIRRISRLVKALTAIDVKVLKPTREILRSAAE